MKSIWLSRTIPAIKLKYNERPKKGEHIYNGLVCEACGTKNIRVGSGGNRPDGSQYIICEDCAIDNYRYWYGFRTRRAAAAHRRRMFDVQYLFCEMLVDIFLQQRGLKDIDDMSQEQVEALFSLTQDFYNEMIPRSAKIRLENTEDQQEIEKYLTKKTKKAGVFLSMIP